MRVSPDSKTVYVYNAMDFSVSIYSAELRLQSSVKTCDPPKTPEWVRGKNCSIPPNSHGQPALGVVLSCHPDGRRPRKKPEACAHHGLWGMAHARFTGPATATGRISNTIRGRSCGPRQNPQTQESKRAD